MCVCVKRQQVDSMQTDIRWKVQRIECTASMEHKLNTVCTSVPLCIMSRAVLLFSVCHVNNELRKI